ncbi:ATP-binding protein [Butyrivibrio fibrisolvens]|uniref:ATP-binding protein n=1 Tax=Butyrivibrio fibrisolvens TaxID=831 RepID=UPI0020BF2D5C|nr:ATP-binding protein [Butyrivibrio fibrisolvens]
MILNNRQLPVGIQSFEKLIDNNNLYVDKTEYVYRLVHTGMPYFLSRPRRFGKSLLLSTMKAYWEGKKELFKGLKIEELERDNPDAWQPYPVFYFDFNKANFAEDGALEAILEVQLQEWEKLYGETSKKVPLGARFGLLLKAAFEKTGKRCVVLVDEYDKPLLETMDNKQLVEHNKAVFKGFFSVLKSEDAHIQFVFITGVTKFSKVSIFSDINQLMDISMSMDYADICGITEKEIRDNFGPEVENLAKEQDLTTEECLEKLKLEYDGYHFHQKGSGVYNPYSLLNALFNREFDSYWFETGTPTFLVKRLRNMNFDVRKFNDKTLYATKDMLKDYRDDNPDVVPLLYQSGYLTLIDYNIRDQSYTLGFPNNEVQYGFFKSLLPVYVGDAGTGTGKDILSLKNHIEAGDLDDIKKVFMAIFAGIPYSSNDDPFEHDFQSVFYITLTLLGQYVRLEQHTNAGRIDCTVETNNYVYLFEFKRDDSADNALKQIDDMHYADTYAADKRTLYKIGVSFDSETRQMAEWKVKA